MDAKLTFLHGFIKNPAIATAAEGERKYLAAMKLLIVAATEGEIGPFTAHMTGTQPSCQVLITGVGMIATAYALTKHLQANTYDLVLQVGVCGAYDTSLHPGDVVFVHTDGYGDLGAEDHDNYLDIFSMGLLDGEQHPHSGGRLVTPLLPVHDMIDLPKITGLTVNMVSGNERTIHHRASTYGCVTESMEGAAFHYVCLQEGVPFAQIRAVSNYVIPRDKSQWKMKDAIINLNKWLIGFVNEVNK